MLTKVLAAKRAARSARSHGDRVRPTEPDVLVRLARGENRRTLLKAATPTLAARKQWLADHLRARRLMLDAGAVKRFARPAQSLLPIGVHEVSGEFDRGEVVGCCNPDGAIARGLVNYSAAGTRRI